MTGQPFNEWLRQRALAAGYDVDSAKGGRSRLAEDAGMSVTQVGRTLTGETVPSVESQRGLCRAFKAKGVKVSLDEMMIRSGVAEPSDFPAADDPRTGSTDIYEIAAVLGIDRSDVPLLQALVEGLQKRRARLGKERTQLYSRVTDLATKLSWDDAHHSGDIPEVLSGLHRLAEDLQDDAE